MREQHADEGPGAFLVTQATAGGVEEALVGGAEAPRGPGLIERGGTGEGPGLVHERLEVVVEVERLDPFAHRPGMTGHDACAVESFERLGPQADADAASRHSARAPSRSTDGRRPGSWHRPGAAAAGRHRRARRAAHAGGEARGRSARPR